MPFIPNIVKSQSNRGPKRFLSPDAGTTRSFVFNETNASAMSPDPRHPNSTFTNVHNPTSQRFDISRRNVEHPFFSSPYSMQKQNDQHYGKLKNSSRFQDTSADSPGSKTKLKTFDIQGNSFKNTLFPKETYGNQYRQKINKSITGTTVTDSEPVNGQWKFYKAQKCEIGYQDMAGFRGKNEDKNQTMGSPAVSSEDHSI